MRIQPNTKPTMMMMNSIALTSKDRFLEPGVPTQALFKEGGGGIGGAADISGTSGAYMDVFLRHDFIVLFTGRVQKNTFFILYFF